MLQELIRIFKDSYKAFLPSNPHLMKELVHLEHSVNKKFAVANCRRIIAAVPFLLFIYVANMRLLLKLDSQQYITEAWILSAALVSITLLSVVVIFRKILLNRTDNTVRLRLLCRIFWSTWFVLSIIMAIIQMKNGFTGLRIVYTCIIISVVYMTDLLEFVMSITIDLILMLLVFSEIIFEIDSMNKFILLLVVTIHLLCCIVQRIWTLVWISREYLYMEAFIDPLTGLLNRRGGNEVLLDEISDLKSEDKIGIIMFDVDYFKKFNDKFGHAEGDVCLKMIADTVRETMSSRTDLLIRHGGEEFVALLPDTDETELRDWAEKVRAAVYEKKMETAHKETADYVTVSVGTAMESVEKKNILYEDLLSNADNALYEAKRAGRNRVVQA